MPLLPSRPWMGTTGSRGLAGGRKDTIARVELFQTLVTPKITSGSGCRVGYILMLSHALGWLTAGLGAPRFADLGTHQ